MKSTILHTVDEDARRRFEAAWAAGAAPPIEPFLPPENNNLYQATLIELVLIDLEFQWKVRGPSSGPATTDSPARVEAYLARFPALDQPMAVLQLVRQEYRVRHIYGDQPPWSEYRQRFPVDVVTAAEPEITLPSPGETHPELPQVPGYLVSEVLGRGGMGLVLRAHDDRIGRWLAIKVLLPHSLSGVGGEQRLLAEARITARLQHPGIPPVHEVGRLPDGRPFFSMKLIEGRTLADLLRQRATPHADLPRFLKIFEQIAQTLAYAHAQRVIHRDLKPSNIMVGAFGEVQVMDWGLARRIRGGEGGDEPAAASGWQPVAGGAPGPLAAAPEADVTPEIPPAPPTTIAAKNPPTPRPTSDRLTQVGEVLGTPAFMAPEQARGAIDVLDERADVFGLGAILCVVLTGAPPYAGHQGPSVLGRAADADLAEAFEALQDCGADADLIALCKGCLNASAPARPAHGGVVAERISAYLVSLQEQLERTRVERAAAVVRASEERKRRRLVGGLAVAVVALVVGGAAAALWYVGDQAGREAETGARRAFLQREVAGALAEAERQRDALHRRLQDDRQAAQLHSDLVQWKQLLETAQAAHRRAEVLAAGGRELLSAALRERLDTLGEQLQTDERDRRLAFELDRIRLESSGVVAGLVRFEPAAPRLARVFQEAGYPIRDQRPGHVAARIRRSRIRRALVASLDFWALAEPDFRQRERLLAVARAADPDPWRDRFRRSHAWHDRGQLHTLIGDPHCARQPPQLLVALGQSYQAAGGDASGLLRRALLLHPRDFWLSFELGVCSRKPLEQAGAFRTALAVRPDAAEAHYNLGVILGGQSELDEAASCYRSAITLRPTHSGAYNNLGLILEKQHHVVEAIACYRQAIASEPKYASAHINLGSALQTQGRVSEAVGWYRKGLAIDPNHAAGQNNLGTALRHLNRLDEAIVCFRAAIKIDPNHAMAWCNLGHVLRQQERFQEALPVFRRAHELGSRQKDWSYPTLYWVAETQRWIALDKQFTALKRGKGPPADPRRQLELAEFCVSQKKRYVAAARLYASALAAEPKLAEDLTAGHRYQTARAVARAVNGEGKDAADFNPSERPRWRKQALDWLTADLKAWRVYLHGNRDATTVTRTLQQWQNDAALAGVRDEQALKSLSADERAAWRDLWAAIESLRSQAEKGTP
jgi:tetratricopeptide (TPR) repeat protein